MKKRSNKIGISDWMDTEMNNRILELARAFNLSIPDATEFYHLAHADGQRAMRERAANECEDQWLQGRISSKDYGQTIRNLEIE